MAGLIYGSCALTAGALTPLVHAEATVCTKPLCLSKPRRTSVIRKSLAEFWKT